MDQISGLRSNSKVLEVGCGTGQSLLSLDYAGFFCLSGIDLFIDSDINYDCGVRILKKELNENLGKFHLIMLHHAFEHFVEPKASFEIMHKLLYDSGLMLLRIPIVPSYAWRKYKTNWVQLDAPRHIFLHSIKSIKEIADAVGFDIEMVKYDSTHFQFWGSEQYLKDIPLHDKKSLACGVADSIFSEDKIATFKLEAERLNAQNDGDQVIISLKKR